MLTIYDLTANTNRYLLRKLCCRLGCKLHMKLECGKYSTRIVERRIDATTTKTFLGFLTYSDYALRTGWYTAQLYYDRGVVYERMKDFKKAKKEYKKAKKAGSPMAYQALLSCKRNEKEYKRQQKEYKRQLKEARKRKHK